MTTGLVKVGREIKYPCESCIVLGICSDECYDLLFMKRSFINKNLNNDICPDCKNNGLNNIRYNHTEQRYVDGQIVCSKCNHIFLYIIEDTFKFIDRTTTYKSKKSSNLRLKNIS